MAYSVFESVTFVVGTATVIEGKSPAKPFATVLEDDGATGYFYGLDLDKIGTQIVDALHIYNAATVTDRDKPSVVEIGWSRDGLKSALIINNMIHAAFDFEERRGYCRTGFPPPDVHWTKYDHSWSDDVYRLGDH